ncbi:MAG: hypothetical protein IKO01_07965 [Kiritimatiellae bacterium]|nr:hypothetical protein [Kiritimatiellia bacterium]
MKKLMSLVALAVVGSVVAASAQEVLSANAVGYVKRTVPAKGLQIVTVPFDNVATAEGYKFGETQIASDLPVGSSVMFWDATAQSWSVGSKNAKGWGAYANKELAVGEPFFLQNATDSDVEVTAAGEVPSTEKLARPYVGNKGLSFVAYPYPCDVNFGDTELATQLPVGASAMFWDSSAQSWAVGSKNAKGWGAYATKSVEAGEGFFVQSSSEGTWEAAKPYTWP